MTRITLAVAAVFAALTTLVHPAVAQTPQVRAAVLQAGTVNWELDTIIRNGFDEAQGFELVMQPYADNGATRVALEGGAADLVVADWIWAARQRAEGRDYVFLPYSTAVGSIVVPADSPAKTLEDLMGKRIGIAGGPLDKSWLILRAYATQEYGIDLAAGTEQVYGAPPLIFKAALDGEVEGAINFWHWLAKMKAQGMRELVSVAEASQALGLDPDTPLLGYVMKAAFLEEHPGIAQDLYRASRAAKDLLATDDTAWEALRDQMNADDEAQFAALRDDYRAGIPKPGPVDTAAADRMLRLMSDLGGADLVGQATTVPEGLFVPVD